MWKNKRFVKCPTLLLTEYANVTPSAKLLYLILCMYAFDKPGRKNQAWPGHQELAEYMNCSVKSITNMLKNLRDNGLVTSDRRGPGLTSMHHLLPVKSE